METLKYTKGWESILKNSIRLKCPFLDSTLLFWIPAFLNLYGCLSGHELEKNCQETGSNDFQIQENLPERSGRFGLEEVYVFTYNDDMLRRLDAWQRYPHLPEGDLGIDSRTGHKHVVLCANTHRETFSWNEIQSYGHLAELVFPLEQEDPQAPLCTQELKIAAGKHASSLMTDLQPFMSGIRISTLEVDFSGTAYAGSALTDISIYLTNLNAEISLVENDYNSCRRIINHRCLNLEDMRRFKQSNLVHRRIGNLQDGQTVHPSATLWTFPNTCPEETMGSPYTRLVIEGKINGKTYWYPINVNRSLDGNGKGIERNFIYNYNITIRRSGSSDPDIPVDFRAVETTLKTRPWKEKEEYEVSY